MIASISHRLKTLHRFLHKLCFPTFFAISSQDLHENPAVQVPHSLHGLAQDGHQVHPLLRKFAAAWTLKPHVTTSRTNQKLLLTAQTKVFLASAVYVIFALSMNQSLDQLGLPLGLPSVKSKSCKITEQRHSNDRGNRKQQHTCSGTKRHRQTLRKQRQCIIGSLCLKMVEGSITLDTACLNRFPIIKTNKKKQVFEKVCFLHVTNRFLRP